MATDIVHQPCLALLTCSASLTFCTLVASVPLIPGLMGGDSIWWPCACITSFLLPAIALHFVILRAAATHLQIILPLPSVLATVSTLVLALWPSGLWGIASLLAFTLLGIASAISQSAIFRLVDLMHEDAAPSARRLATGLHIGFLDLCVGAATIAAPPLFAVIARASPRAPFISAAVLFGFISLTVSIRCVPLQNRTDSNFSEEASPLLPIKTERTNMSRNTVIRVLRHPWSWVIVFAAASCTAALSSTRLLVLLITGDTYVDKFSSALPAAGFLSLIATIGLIVPPFFAALVVPRLGTRALFFGGVGVMALGFHILSTGLYIIGLATGTAGASTAVTIALTEMAHTAGVSVDSVSDPVAVFAASIFVLAEVAGTIAVPLSIGSMNHDDNCLHRVLKTLSFFATFILIFVAISLLIFSAAQCLAPLIPVFSMFYRRSQNDTAPTILSNPSTPPTPMQTTAGPILSQALGRQSPT